MHNFIVYSKLFVFVVTDNVASCKYEYLECKLTSL